MRSIFSPTLACSLLGDITSFRLVAGVLTHLYLLLSLDRHTGQFHCRILSIEVWKCQVDCNKACAAPIVFSYGLCNRLICRSPQQSHAETAPDPKPALRFRILWHY